MVLLCAGRTTKNAGRYYYKCPLYEDHLGSFKWFDAWEAENNPTMQAMTTKLLGWPQNTHKRPDDCGDGHATCSRSSPQSNGTGFASTVLLLFRSLVLVLIGIVIDKLC